MCSLGATARICASAVVVGFDGIEGLGSLVVAAIGAGALSVALVSVDSLANLNAAVDLELLGRASASALLVAGDLESAGVASADAVLQGVGDFLRCAHSDSGSLTDLGVNMTAAKSSSIRTNVDITKVRAGTGLITGAAAASTASTATTAAAAAFSFVGLKNVDVCIISNYITEDSVTENIPTGGISFLRDLTEHFLHGGR